jgi:hypothetical protein
MYLAQVNEKRGEAGATIVKLTSLCVEPVANRLESVNIADVFWR